MLVQMSSHATLIAAAVSAAEEAFDGAYKCADSDVRNEAVMNPVAREANHSVDVPHGHA
jgi:hypothetical protein